MHAVFRPWFGRMLTIAIAVICVAGAVVLTWREGLRTLWQLGPWLALAAGTCWAVFWRPCVEVTDGGVRLVNVFRTIDLPWPSIREIDTRWALTLVTAYGTFRAWAAPAPGMQGSLRATRSDARHLPAPAGGSSVLRPGDLPSSPSGEAATLIRRHWAALRDAGHLDNPRLEHERAPVRWHTEIIAAGAALAVLCVLSLVV